MASLNGALALLKLLLFVLLSSFCTLFCYLKMSIFLYAIRKQAFRAQNLESAKSRLNLCAEDVRGQIEKVGNTSELCSQLGAVLGMLGDCWYVCAYVFLSFNLLIYRVHSFKFVGFNSCRILLLSSMIRYY